MKSCNFLRFATSGKFKEFFFEVVLLPNLISRLKFSEIALTAEDTADLNLSSKILVFQGYIFFQEIFK